jgi:hypothetical protein
LHFCKIPGAIACHDKVGFVFLGEADAEGGEVKKSGQNQVNNTAFWGYEWHPLLKHE